MKLGAGGVNVFDCDHTGVHRLATYGISTIRKQLQDVDVGGKMSGASVGSNLLSFERCKSGKIAGREAGRTRMPSPSSQKWST